MGNKKAPIPIPIEKRSALHPNIFGWKEGFETWKKARDVPELKILFKDTDEK